VAVAGCLASSVVWLTGSTFAGPAAGAPTGRDALRVLQLNLCGSGIAGCYTGRSVSTAAAVIRNERPDVVTLNEVCRDDVSALARATSETFGGTPVASAFKAAVDRRTNAPFRCLSGEPYGIGVVALLRSAAAGHRTYGGVYPTQDLTDPEERVWLCLAPSGGLLTCTTHTASTSTAVALAQCRYLLDEAVPAVGRPAGDAAVVLGADLNLRAGGSPSPQSCLPPGYQRADDGARQDVITGPGLTLRSRTVLDLHGATDHPGLLVEVGLPADAAH